MSEPLTDEQINACREVCQKMVDAGEPQAEIWPAGYVLQLVDEIERLRQRVDELEGDDPTTWHASCDCGWLHKGVSGDRHECSECGATITKEGTIE